MNKFKYGTLVER